MPERRGFLGSDGPLRLARVVAVGVVAAGALVLAPAREAEVLAGPESGPGQGASTGGPGCGTRGIYTDPSVFESHLAQLGIVPTAYWDFTPHDVPPATAVALADPLNINTHALNANDPWTGGGGQNYWPPELNNVQFTSNTTPNGPLTPRGPSGLTFASPGFAGNDNVLGATFVEDSLDVVCEQPGGASCQAMALELSGAGVFRVRLYFFDGKVGQQQYETVVNVPQGQSVFVGFLRSRIVRVDIWDDGGAERISSIALYRWPSCPADVDGSGTIGVGDLISVILAWGACPAPPSPCPGDVARDGDVNVEDLVQVIVAWGQTCPPHAECAGENPSTGNCASDDDCQPPEFCNHTICTPAACICVLEGWICTDGCCGRCEL